METFRLIACPTLSHERRQDRYMPSGKTVGECLRELGWKTDGLSARVFIDGQLVPNAEWEHATPTAGQAVVVRSIPQGGPGQNRSKEIGRIVSMLVVALAAIVAQVAIPGILGTIVAATISIGGTLALNGRIPTPLPRRSLPVPMRIPLKEAA